MHRAAPRRLGVRLSATVVLAVCTLVGLTACGSDNPGRDDRPRATRTDDKPSETTSSGAPSVDPSGTVSPTTTSTSTPTPTPTETPKPKQVKITIKDGKIDGPSRLTASIGQTVQIEIRSDVADELHVHGIEQTLAVPADERVTLEFVVPPEPGPGSYAVELHVSGQLLFALEVR